MPMDKPEVAPNWGQYGEKRPNQYSIQQTSSLGVMLAKEMLDLRISLGGPSLVIKFQSLRKCQTCPSATIISQARGKQVSWQF